MTYQQDVGNDGPVEVEGDLSQEEEDEGHVDVPVGGEEAEGEEHGRGEEAEAADERVGARVLLLQLGAQDGAEGHADDAGEHGDEAEDERDVPHVDRAGVGAGGGLGGGHGRLDVLGAPPGERAGAEGDAGEGEGREDEGAVLGQAAQVLGVGGGLEVAVALGLAAGRVGHGEGDQEGGHQAEDRGHAEAPAPVAAHQLRGLGADDVSQTAGRGRNTSVKCIF